MLTIKEFVDNYSFGKFYIFDGQNKCFVLADEQYDDFVGIIRVDDSHKLSMYENTTKYDVTHDKINLIVNRINTKIYKSTLCSFTLSLVDISKIKDSAKSYTHIEFVNLNNHIHVRYFDYRDLIVGVNTIELQNLGKTTTHKFQKIINVNTFLKFCKQQDYIVNISSGDFIEFESMNDSYSLIFQEQLLN
jgi:hypothetical protein